MRFRSPHGLVLALAACLLLSAAVQAQVISFGGDFGPGLSPEDNRLMVESIARLNAAEPSRVGLSESWNNTQTRTSGSSTILRVFHSRGMACHQLRHQIVAAGQSRPRDYRLTWCRTATGEWKIKA
jgi:surface antigen